jgi:hypothetical protein
MLMPNETWARDVDAPAINMTATNKDDQRNFPTALNFLLQCCRIRWSKVPSSELRVRLMVGLGTNLVCAVVNTRRNSGAIVIPTERFMDEPISCNECLVVGTIL